MPSLELFEKQSKKYKDEILGKNPRVIIEAASSFGWHKYLRDSDSIFSIDKFGESGKAIDLFNYFGLNPLEISKKILNLYFKNGKS